MLRTCSHSISSAHITQIKLFSEIEKTIAPDESTLILLDIDNTILTSAIDYGTIEYFYHLLQQEMIEKQKSEFEAKLTIHDRWIRSQTLIQTKLTDEKVGEFIKNAQSKKVPVIGFTARPPQMQPITLQQLARHFLTFDALPGFEFSRNYHVYPIARCEKTFETHALFASGVVFCHDLNTKGAVFKDWFSVFSSYRQNKELPEIKKIIFVDDAAYNFESMQQEAMASNLAFYGFHFQYQNNFDAIRAAIQEKKLNANRPYADKLFNTV